MSKPPGHSFPGTFPACLLAAFCLLLPRPLAAQTVTLLLRNGDRITGSITSEDASRIVLATSWSKEVTVAAREVTKRETVTAAADGAPASVATNVQANTQAAATPAVLARKAPAPPIEAKRPKYWVGEVQMGVDLAFSEKDQQLYSGRARLTYGRNRFHNAFDYLFSYGRASGLVSANRMDGAIKTDLDVGRRWYLYNLIGAGYDQIRKIDDRYEVGPGVGFHWITRSNFVANLEAGFNYQAQYLADHTSTEFFYYRVAENSTWKVTDRFSIDEKFEFFPRVEQMDEYRFRFESNLRYSLKNNISLNLTIFDQYETNPARNVTRNDLQVRSSIGVKF